MKRHAHALSISPPRVSRGTHDRHGETSCCVKNARVVRLNCAQLRLKQLRRCQINGVQASQQRRFDRFRGLHDGVVYAQEGEPFKDATCLRKAQRCCPIHGPHQFDPKQVGGKERRIRCRSHPDLKLGFPLRRQQVWRRRKYPYFFPPFQNPSNLFACAGGSLSCGAPRTQRKPTPGT
jgi:hypothetical protein